jgi:hypothetical protein
LYACHNAEIEPDDRIDPEKGSLAISVLSADCPLSLIAGFGQRSGRDSEKIGETPCKTDGNGNPYIDAVFGCLYEHERHGYD